VKRRQPTLEELKHIREAACADRVAAGLPAVSPDDAEHEQRLREREALKKRRR
jgi:hypothetical protein